MGFFDSSGPAVSFNRLGDSVTGIIDGPYTERQATEFGSNKLKFYSDGRPWMMACVPLRTNDRDPADPRDDGVRTLYVDKISMRDAIVSAFKAVGAKDLEEGGTLTVQYVGDEDSGKGNPSKLFAAQYSRPTGMLGQPSAGGNGAAQQPYQQPPAYQAVQAPPAPQYPPMTQVPQQPSLMPPAPSQPPTAPAGGDYTGQIAAIRAMSAAGMTAVQISQAVPSFTPEAVQAVMGLPV